jgi:hypothetical protein
VDVQVSQGVKECTVHETDVNSLCDAVWVHIEIILNRCSTSFTPTFYMYSLSHVLAINSKMALVDTGLVKVMGRRERWKR